jgi:phosphate transport system ATP-binding protein
MPREAVLEARGLGVTAAGRHILRGVSLKVPPRQVLGLIGPSGAGKTTLLRCLNRLVDLSPGLRVEGEVLFHGRDVYAPGTDVDALRARVGMVFQQPVVFPRSVLENVVFGARHLRTLPRRRFAEVAEAALREAALWDEVKDRLHEAAQSLSVGQQQRLCLARALAVDPEVILMDEPTSALDPRSTEAIEELVRRLKEHRAIVLVTHNLGQARRLADWLACLCVRDGVGQVAETACCDTLLDAPECQEVVEFLRARP